MSRDYNGHQNEKGSAHLSSEPPLCASEQFRYNGDISQLPYQSLLSPMQYPQLPTVAFISAFLILIPLPSHWRAGNVATLALIFWLFFANIIYGVNSIIWSGTALDLAPVWCDISEYLVAFLSVSSLKSRRHEIHRWRLFRITSLYTMHLQTPRNDFFVKEDLLQHQRP